MSLEWHLDIKSFICVKLLKGTLSAVNICLPTYNLWEVPRISHCFSLKQKWNKLCEVIGNLWGFGFHNDLLQSFRYTFYKLCFCVFMSPSRLVHSGSARGSPAQSSELLFATRTGTGRGIESHIFRVETHWDLSSWTRAMVQGAHAAAELIKEVSIGEKGCNWS